jgi:hypothetical protein
MQKKGLWEQKLYICDLKRAIIDICYTCNMLSQAITRMYKYTGIGAHMRRKYLENINAYSRELSLHLIKINPSLPKQFFLIIKTTFYL